MDPPPLVTHRYTADPSAHVFNGRVYIYPSHDRESSVADNDNGDQYDMVDYHVYSLPHIPDFSSDPAKAQEELAAGLVTDHGAVLAAPAVPWVKKQMWAPDAALNPTDGKYYLFFPARDYDGIFRIGVAVGDRPEGPFTPEPEPIPGSFSIDPASFVDDDGQAYLYFGGIWGGQLQCWRDTARFDRDAYKSMEATGDDEPALFPKVAVLASDMRSFAGPVTDVVILDDETGAPIHSARHDKRFFEASWMHKRDGRYYFSYSTGDTHYLVYAVADSPLGPFTYAGRILEPVQGWTTHHSIVEFGERWWLFYHDTSLSGKNHLRSVKVRELVYDDEGRIQLAQPQLTVQA